MLSLQGRSEGCEQQWRSQPKIFGDKKFGEWAKILILG